MNQDEEDNDDDEEDNDNDIRVFSNKKGLSVLY